MIRAVLVVLAACSTAPHAPDAATPTGPSVAGVYATAVTLQRSSCVGIMVRDMPTTVSLDDATRLTLRHAGNGYTGTLAADNTFTTTPRSLGEPAETHTLTITGAFVTNGFTATVHADVTRDGAAACTYDVRWIGTRTSP